MKKALLVLLTFVASTTLFAQSFATSEGSASDESVKDVSQEIAEDGTIITTTSDDAKQNRSVSSGSYYAKPAGMMYITFLNSDFDRNTYNTMCQMPFFDEFKYENMSRRPLRTYWNIKTELGSEGTNVDSDKDGNLVQSLLPGELGTLPYLYNNDDGTYYNMAYREYNSSSTAGKYMHYVVGSGYSSDEGGLGWMSWCDNKNMLVVTSSSTIKSGHYIYGSGDYTMNFTVTDKAGSTRTLYTTFPCHGFGENFYAPASPIYAECIGFHGCTLGSGTSDVNNASYQPLENGAVLTMSLYDQATGELLETLTATTGDWTPLEVSSATGVGSYRRGFLKFTKKVNGEVVPVVIDRAVTIEITGLENADVKVGTFSVYANVDATLDEGFGTAYTMFIDPSGEYEIENADADATLASRPYLPISAYGIMDKVYATEGTNDLILTTDGATCSNTEGDNIGGVIVRTALPWTNETTGEANYTVAEGLPSWLTINCEAYGDQTNEYLISFIADVNHSADERTVTLHLQGKGFTDPTPITITQMAGNGDSDGDVFVEANDETVDITYQVISAGELTCEVIYGLDYNYSGVVNVPEKVVHNGQTYTVVSVGQYAFAESSELTAVTLPSSVTEIKEGAFYNCTGITSFTIPENVTTVGYRAFRSCTGITSIDIPVTVTTWGDEVFSTCTSLTSVTLHEGMTKLGDGMFFNCQKLPSITIPSTVTEIGAWAFQNCYALESITIPKSVTTMGDGAFYYDYGLQSITFEEGCELTAIPDYAFYYCYNAAITNIPKSIISIGYEAFCWCWYYERQAMALDLSGCTNLTYIGVYAFYDCEALTEVKLPESLQNVDEYAFEYCYGLKKADIPSGYIGYGAFYYCTGLEDVNLGDGVISVGDYAFDHCTAVKTVSVGDGCTDLGIQAFCYDDKIENITLGSSVASLGTFAFYYTTVLESITSYNSEPPVCDTNVFYSAPKSTCVVYVPAGSKEAYSAADQWKDFTNIVEMGTVGINTINPDEIGITGYYTIGGQKLNAPVKGINIVRYSDGSTKKVLVK